MKRKEPLAERGPLTGFLEHKQLLDAVQEKDRAIAFMICSAHGYDQSLNRLHEGLRSQIEGLENGALRDLSAQFSKAVIELDSDLLHRIARITALLKKRIGTPGLWNETRVRYLAAKAAFDLGVETNAPPDAKQIKELVEERLAAESVSPSETRDSLRRARKRHEIKWERILDDLGITKGREPGRPRKE